MLTSTGDTVELSLGRKPGESRRDDAQETDNSLSGQRGNFAKVGKDAVPELMGEQAVRNLAGSHLRALDFRITSDSKRIVVAKGIVHVVGCSCRSKWRRRQKGCCFALHRRQSARH